MSDHLQNDFVVEDHFSPSDHLPEGERLRLMQIAILRIHGRSSQAIEWLDGLSDRQLNIIGTFGPDSLEKVQARLIKMEDLIAQSISEGCVEFRVDRMMKAEKASGCCVDVEF